MANQSRYGLLEKHIDVPGVLGGGGHNVLPSSYDASVLTTSPLAYWTLADTSGTIAVDATGNTSNATVTIVGGGFETSGGALVFQGWNQTVGGDGALADEGTIVHSGSHAAKLTQGSSSLVYIHQDFAGMQPGKTARFSVWTRGDGTNGGRYRVYDVTHAAYLTDITAFNVTGTTYTQINIDVTIPAGCASLRLYLFSSAAAGGICYYDDVTVTGLAFDRRGFYEGTTPPTLAARSGPDGIAIPYFGGSGYVDIYSYGLKDVLDGNTGSVMSWWIPEFVWTDANAHDLVTLYTDGTNQIHQYYPGSSTLRSRHIGSNTIVALDNALSAPTTWQCLLTVWAGGTITHYLNGTQIKTASGLGSYAGALALEGAKIGNAAQANVFHSWQGWICKVAVWASDQSANVSLLATGQA